MNITEFGKFIRKFRLDHDERLFDMAQKLQVSSAFLSSVETGKKSIPQKMLDKIKTVYNMSDECFQQLIDAARKTAEAAKEGIVRCDNTHLPAVEHFARSTSDLREDEMLLLQSEIDNFIKKLRGEDNNAE